MRIHIILAAWIGLTLALPAAAQSNRAQILSDGIAAAMAEDWATARRSEAQLNDPAGKDAVAWVRLRQRGGAFPEYIAFMDRNPDWPGLRLMARRGEALIPQDARGTDVLAYFREREPQTGEGSLILARVERARGNTQRADALIVRAWRNFTLGEETEAKFLAGYRQLLAEHHTARIDNLLWQGQIAAARRMLPLVNANWRASSEARIALRGSERGVDAKIEAVPAGFANGAGLAYERFLWRLRKGRTASAVEIMLERSTSVGALGRPESWANQRRMLARNLMRANKNAEAYQLAASHQLKLGTNYADLEWLAGYLSLRKLDQPARALRHFQNFRAAVNSPISLGRAGYWEGRAYEAMGQTANAEQAYRQGALYQTSFYGQLAAERAGVPTDPALLGGETFPDWRQGAFMSSSALRAALFFQEAGELALAQRFMVNLSETLTWTERGQLTELALDLNEPYIALGIAKHAVTDGPILHKAYHPISDIGRVRLPIDPALALAITRRESEFNPGVISPAGARGLMQLMPRTGAAMAQDIGISGFSTKQLIDDPSLNVRLGSEYLSQQIEDFGDNVVLVASAYNAGPSRARAWVGQFGDPRGGRIDVVDWIEHVPFRETRNYIMRVTESMLVYEMMLAGRPLKLEPTRRLTKR